MLNCRDTAKLASEAMDRTLPLMRRISVKIHLMMCKFCRRYLRQVRFIREILQLAPEEMKDAPESTAIRLSSDARVRIREAMRNY
jgi:hypothetical protein